MRYGLCATTENWGTAMADHKSSEHVHGSMDIRAQEKTFAGFIRMSVWVTVAVIVVLVFMGLVNA
jgi:Ni,Fe-hydrogenase I cytochrome b subunit